jgi:hypothetical protein
MGPFPGFWAESMGSLDAGQPDIRRVARRRRKHERHSFDRLDSMHDMIRPASGG